MVFSTSGKVLSNRSFRLPLPFWEGPGDSGLVMVGEVARVVMGAAVVVGERGRGDGVTVAGEIGRIV